MAVALFGVSFGVLAVHVHITGWAVVLMSALVFAGSAQFAAIGVLAAGGGVVAAVLAGVLLNLRYLAIGAAVAPSLPGGPLRRLILGQLSVDESYAIGVAAGQGGRPDGRTVIITGSVLYVAWVIGTLIGVLLGPVFGDPARFGLDAAFPALFVALLWPMLTTRRAIRAAVAGAAAVVVVTPFMPPGVPLAIAAVVGLLVSQ